MERIKNFLVKYYKIAAASAGVLSIAAICAAALLKPAERAETNAMDSAVKSYQEVGGAYFDGDETPDTAEDMLQPEESAAPETEQTAKIVMTAAPEQKARVSEEKKESVSRTSNAGEPENEGLTCTVSISCAAILDNMDLLEPSKLGIIPSDGLILRAEEIDFEEGDSAFDALYKAARENGIHMEFTRTPAFDSVYIEGIANIYEFDCGPTSGWQYRVNGEFLGIGCSSYELHDGDIVEFLYTCNLGRDIGGYNGL